MSKIIRIGIVLLVTGIAMYIYLLSPSTDELNGDQAFELGNYRQAIVQYTRALSSNKISFSEERISFKLGNSYRLAGENQRAFDFYFSILRKNKTSVYRERIQTFLRHEATDLQAEMSVGKIKLDLSFLKEMRRLSIVELKSKRDELYLILLQSLSEMSSGSVDYRLLDLYENFTKVQANYVARKESEFVELDRIVHKRVMRKFGTLNLESLNLPPLSTLSEFYKVEQVKADSWTDLYSGSKFSSVDAFIVDASNESHTNLSLHLQRLYDFHQKAKLFLIFDDSIWENISQEHIAQYANFGSILQCGNANPCAEVLRQVIHRRSLWQFDG